MGRKKSIWFLVTAFVIVLFFVQYRDVPMSSLQRADERIAALEQKLAEQDLLIQNLYSSLQKRIPRNPFYSLQGPWVKNVGDAVWGDHLEALKKKETYAFALSDLYKQKGNYFLQELFVHDADAPKKYTRYKSINSQNFLMKLKQGDAEAQSYLAVLQETRHKALEYYSQAMDIRDDYSSYVYALQGNRPLLEPIPLKLSFVVQDAFPLRESVKQEDIASLVHVLLKDAEFRKRYLANRVQASLHHQVGIAFFQLGNLASLAKENAADVLAMLDNAEREYYIALGVDSEYVNVVYDLGRLYLWRYEYSREYRKEYLLGKIVALLRNYLFRGASHSVQMPDTLGHSSQKRFVVKMSPSDEIGSLFVLARGYYHLAFLEEDALKSLRELYTDICPEEALSAHSKYFINQAITLYKDSLLAQKLSEGSESYKNAQKALTQLYKLQSQD